VTDNCIAPDVFDRLRTATAKNPAELAELCRDYLTEGRRTLAELRHALRECEAERLRYHAHYLKGSSLIIGTTGVTQCCLGLEEMGRKDDVRGAEHLLEQMAAALDSAEKALARELGLAALPAEGSAA
jgi:HPt (histidine-containing phosphotransfer) domain-containing protein